MSPQSQLLFNSIDEGFCITREIDPAPDALALWLIIKGVAPVSRRGMKAAGSRSSPSAKLSTVL
jgi:hypothetical protein